MVFNWRKFLLGSGLPFNVTFTLKHMIDGLHEWDFKWKLAKKNPFSSQVLMGLFKKYYNNWGILCDRYWYPYMRIQLNKYSAYWSITLNGILSNHNNGIAMSQLLFHDYWLLSGLQRHSKMLNGDVELLPCLEHGKWATLLHLWNDAHLMHYVLWVCVPN